MTPAGRSPGARIPPRLARRIDRLAGRAHAFHRFAHHPLCAAYAPEVLPLGRRLRVCRGCALLAAGGSTGLVAGLLLPPPGAAGLAAGLAALALLAVPAVRSRAPGRPRGAAGKLVTRALPMGLCAALALLGLRAANPAGLAASLAALAVLTAAWVAYRRRGPDRGACAACPEAPASGSCSGFAPMARRERAFRRLSARWLAARSPGA